MEKKNWPKKTAKRFVAFFDIMGFKEIVERNDHKIVVEKLEKLKMHLMALEDYNKSSEKDKFSETRSITFSDSIVIFSKDNTVKDASKILFDSSFLLHIAFKEGIAIKGALSYGEITVDFENSLFFGRPIIDSYLLHDQLHMYTAILDCNFESMISTMDIPNIPKIFIIDYKTNLKGGKVQHKILTPGNAFIENGIEDLKKMYQTVSGNPRLYVDNTLDFLNSIKPK